MSSSDTTAEITELLVREGMLLDEQRWEDWLALYTDQTEYWVPSWKSEYEPTDDPHGEISLIYLTSKTRLAERIQRIRSGKSAATLVIPRTVHTISNILVEDAKDDEAIVRCSAVTHMFDPKRRQEQQSFCRYQMKLVKESGGWKIAAKKIILINDNLPTKLEFYML